jgi:hypothetical protein
MEKKMNQLVISRLFGLHFILSSILLISCRNTNEKKVADQKQDNSIHLNQGIVKVSDNTKNAYSDIYDYQAEFHFYIKNDDSLLQKINSQTLILNNYKMEFRLVEKVSTWGNLKDTTIGKNVINAIVYGKKTIDFKDFILDMEKIAKNRKYKLGNLELIIDSIYYPKAIDATDIFIH